MIKEQVSIREMMFTIIMFIIGSSIIVGIGNGSEHDVWISLLIGAGAIIPIFIMYARILKLFPEKNIFEIIEELFGKIIGKVIIILFSWYALHLASLVLRDFSEFIKIAGMPETPEIPVMILILIICTYLAKSGVETLGRWALFTLPILVFILFFTVIVAIPSIDVNNLLPVMNHSAGILLSDSLAIFTFPFGEIVLFLAIGNTLKKGENPYKMFIYATMIGMGLLLIVGLRNIIILGSEMKNVSYFASYQAVRIISLGDFLTRIEGAIMVNFLFAGIVKITVCLFAAAKGITKLFNLSNYKKIVIPMSLSVLALTPILYNNINEMFDFLDTYKIYALPFQIGIPLIIWVFAEIKFKIVKSKTNCIQN